MTRLAFIREVQWVLSVVEVRSGFQIWQLSLAGGFRIFAFRWQLSGRFRLTVKQGVWGREVQASWAGLHNSGTFRDSYVGSPEGEAVGLIWLRRRGGDVNFQRVLH